MSVGQPKVYAKRMNKKRLTKRWEFDVVVAEKVQGLRDSSAQSQRQAAEEHRTNKTKRGMKEKGQWRCGGKEEKVNKEQRQAIPPEGGPNDLWSKSKRVASARAAKEKKRGITTNNKEKQKNKRTKEDGSWSARNLEGKLGRNSVVNNNVGRWVSSLE